MSEKSFAEMTPEEYQAYRDKKQIEFLIKTFEEGMNYQSAS